VVSGRVGAGFEIAGGLGGSVGLTGEALSPRRAGDAVSRPALATVTGESAEARGAESIANWGQRWFR
jgi:hypothetical protein